MKWRRRAGVREMEGKERKGLLLICHSESSREKDGKEGRRDRRA